MLHTHHLWHNAASAYAICGKADKAVPLLRRCAAGLRGDPGFETLMAGLRVEHDVYRAEFDEAAA